MKNLRIWRVQFVKNGMKAPYSFVETKDEKFWQAEKNAMKKAQSESHLAKLGWDLVLTQVEN